MNSEVNGNRWLKKPYQRYRKSRAGQLTWWTSSAPPTQWEGVPQKKKRISEDRSLISDPTLGHRGRFYVEDQILRENSCGSPPWNSFVIVIPRFKHYCNISVELWYLYDILLKVPILSRFFINGHFESKFVETSISGCAIFWSGNTSSRGKKGRQNHWRS